MIYYNQNDYAHVPYPSEARPQSNIKSSGCGVCSACMVVENMTEHKLSVEECAKFSLSVGGRDNFGTDMEKLAPPLCERFGLAFEATDDKEKVLEFLNNNRGMVIANPGGDREGHVGLFTTSGHYIVLAKRGNAPCASWTRTSNPTALTARAAGAWCSWMGRTSTAISTSSWRTA